MSEANDAAFRKAKFYQDLFALPEDERINLIGHYVTAHDETVSVATDADPGKAERYIDKLTTRFPNVEVFERGNGPVPHVVYFKARKKGH